MYVSIEKSMSICHIWMSSDVHGARWVRHCETNSSKYLLLLSFVWTIFSTYKSVSICVYIWNLLVVIFSWPAVALAPLVRCAVLPHRHAGIQHRPVWCTRCCCCSDLLQRVSHWHQDCRTHCVKYRSVQIQRRPLHTLYRIRILLIVRWPLGMCTVSWVLTVTCTVYMNYLLHFHQLFGRVSHLFCNGLLLLYDGRAHDWRQIV